MEHRQSAALAAALFAASLAPQPVFAQDQAATEANTVIDNCLRASSEADKAILGKSCLLAFDGAITQAQRSDVHSPQLQNIYWAQASQISGILVILFVERDKGFGRNACTTAYRGWQSWNQVGDDFKERTGLTVSQALQASTQHCQEQWNRGEWQ